MRFCSITGTSITLTIGPGFSLMWILWEWAIPWAIEVQLSKRERGWFYQAGDLSLVEGLYKR